MDAGLALCGMLGWGLAAGPAELGEGLAPLPAFVENAGQWPAAVRHRARFAGATAWFVDGGFWLDLRRAGEGCALRFALGSGESRVAPRGEVPLEGVRHFLSGGEAPRTARAFGRLRYAGIAPGTDLVVHEGGGLFEYDLHLAPGIDLSTLELVVEGGCGLAVEAGGVLRLETPVGTLRQDPPRAWSVGPGGEELPVSCRFEVRGEGRYGFAAPDAAKDRPLVVDPGLSWSTYLGDGGDDAVTGLVLAGDGSVIAVGDTSSTTFPVTPGVHAATLAGGYDVFVTRFRPSGKGLVFSTFLGGSGNEHAAGVALGSGGEIWICGETDSPDLPTTVGAWDSSYNGGTDAFLARLDPAGSALLASTYLGAGGDDRARGIAVAPGGEPVVCGASNSPGFPTTPGAFDRTFGGGTWSGGDAIVARLAVDLSGLVFSTYLGASGNEQATDLAVATDGSVTVGGHTTSVLFPVTAGAFDSTHSGSSTDAFVTRLEADGASLRWSTFLGGSGGEQIEGVALDGTEEVVAVGQTDSTDFPVTAGALQGSYAGSTDAFVTRLGALGATLRFSTYLGGGDVDRALDVELDPSGRAAVTGGTFSPDFPSTPWSFQPRLSSPPGLYLADAFVSRFSPGGELLYGSFLGGKGHEEGAAIAVDWLRGVAVGGGTNSSSFPGVYQGFDYDYDGSSIPDGFVSLLDFDPYPYAFGPYKVTSAGWTPYLGSTGFPSFSGGGFSIWIEGGTAHGWGYFLESAAVAPRPFMGGTLLLGHPIERSSLQNLDWFGSATLNIAIEPSMIGTTRYYQAWFVDTGDPYGVGLTDGMAVTFVP